MRKGDDDENNNNNNNNLNGAENNFTVELIGPLISV